VRPRVLAAQPQVPHVDDAADRQSFQHGREVLGIPRFHVLDAQSCGLIDIGGNELKGAHAPLLPLSESCARWVRRKHARVQMQRVGERIERLGRLDDPSRFHQGHVVRGVRFSQAQVQRQVDGVGEVVLGRQSHETLGLMVPGKVAAVLIGLEQHQLDVVHQRRQVLHVGKDVVGEHV